VKRALVPALALIVVAAGCGGAREQRHASAAAHTSSAPSLALRGRPVLESTAADFALRDQNGSVIRLSAQRGKLVYLTFLYTNCPDVCPLVASNLGGMLRRLPPAERSEVRVIAVSVDPAHDTRAAVRRFVAEHGLPPQFHYLIGTYDELKPIWQSYNLLISVKSVELVSHTTYVLLIDRRGKPRLYYTSHVTTADLLHDVPRLLR
jgi:protein SCO1/2